MNKELLLERLEPIVKSAVREAGLYLIEMDCKGRTLRILVNRPGGVTIGECAELNTALGEALDREGIIDERYMLEVDSPGLDRPLKTREDFICAAGEKVNITFWDGRETRTRFGEIVEVKADTVALKEKEKDLILNIPDIVKANIKVKL